MTTRSATLQRIASGIVASAGAGIMLMDANFKFVFTNTAFEKITGYREDTVRGRNPRRFVSNDAAPGFYREIARSIQNHGFWQGEIWCRRHNGERYPAWLNLSTVQYQKPDALYYIGVLSDVSQLHAQRQQLYQTAHYDPLTGLPNRRLFHDRVRTAISHARRHGTGGALLFVDLDHFKYINDHRGHAAGDRVLREVAQRLRASVRATDTVARLGGDEFIVLLADARDDAAAATVATKMLDSLLGTPLAEGDPAAALSASIGIARFPKDGDNVEALLHFTDLAMYRAKHQGRGRYCFYTAELDQHATQRRDLEAELRDSLARHALEVVWQPQVRLRDDAIVGIEALPRWQSPALNSMPPAQLDALAVQSGLAADIERWLLEHAVSMAARHLNVADVNAPQPRLVFKLTALHATSADYAGEIFSALQCHGLAPERVALEVGGGELVREGQAIRSPLRELAECGIHLVLGGFGTGYANLAKLKRFRLRRLKIDAGFVRGIEHDAVDRQIVGAMITLAHQLGLSIIADGVDTPTQRAMLADLGCDEARGPLFSPPLPLSALQELLGRQRRTALPRHGRVSSAGVE